jgi:hypothetical protein
VAARQNGVDVREHLERAIDIPDFVDYAAAYGYFLHVGEALDEVERLIGAGFADAAITLAEYALELLESSAERVDDSDGGLSEAIARVEEIHLAATARRPREFPPHAGIPRASPR